jgi:hypothetical protein
MEVESETRDRVMSINQASTIERLTYLTILYLPINLMAVSLIARIIYGRIIKTYGL